MSNTPTAQTGPVERRRSGLVRTFSAWGAFLFGIHCISLSSSGFIPYSWVASVWPGADLVWVLTIALGFCVVHAATYAIIGSTVSKAGADYVLASRVLSPSIGFAASWTLVLFSGIVVGGLAAWVPQSAIPALLRPLSIILRDERYNFLADFATTPAGSFVIGAALIIIVTASVLQSGRFIQRVLMLGFVLGLMAWIIILWSLWSAPGPETFVTAWNKFMGPTGAHGDFQSRIPLALAAGMNPNHSMWQMTFAGLIMGFWIFYGYYIPTFFSEEVRNPGKSLFLSSLGALLTSYAIFVVGGLLLYRLVPHDWVAAEGYLFNNPAAATKAAGGEAVVAMPWITFYSAILQPNKVAIVFIAFAWIFTLLNLLQTYFFYASRIVYSWALDRAVPDWVVGPKVTEPHPRRTVLIITGLALVGLFDASVKGPLNTQLTFAFFAVVTGLVPITALTILPWRDRKLFQKMPAFARRRFAGLPFATLLGGGTLLYFLWMIVAAFVFPAVGVGNPVGTLGLLVAFIGSGFLVFWGTRAVRLRRDGIDILATYRIGVPDANEPEFE